MNKITIRVRITGRVQGVCYRIWTVEYATSLGLSGWVRNRLDGSVEAIFCGNQKKIDEMVEALYQGPSAALVTFMTFDYEKINVKPGFKKIPTL
jgi:acylphosphatase